MVCPRENRRQLELLRTEAGHKSGPSDLFLHTQPIAGALLSIGHGWAGSLFAVEVSPRSELAWSPAFLWILTSEDPLRGTPLFFPALALLWGGALIP